MWLRNHINEGPLKTGDANDPKDVFVQKSSD